MPPARRTPRGITRLTPPTQPSSTATWVSDPTLLLAPSSSRGARLALGIALGLEMSDGADSDMLGLPFCSTSHFLPAPQGNLSPAVSVPPPQVNCELTSSPARRAEGKELGETPLSPAGTLCLPPCQKSSSSERSPSRSSGHPSTVRVTPHYGTRRGLPAPSPRATTPPGDPRSP